MSSDIRNDFSWPPELGGNIADLNKRIEAKRALLQLAYDRLKGIFDESRVPLPSFETLDEQQIINATGFIAEEDKGQVMLLTSEFLRAKKMLNDLILQKNSYN